MLKLTTYTQGQYANLKAKLQEKGYSLNSVMELRNSDRINDFLSKQTAFDVSAMLPLYDSTSGIDSLAALLEYLCYQFDDKALFIADEKLATKYAYGIRTLFEIIEKSDIEEGDTIFIKPDYEYPRRIIDLSDEETDELLDGFRKELIGQSTFKEELRKQVDIFRLFNRIDEQPILSLFLLGPSGVGKTETARILGKLLAPNEALPKISFANYSSKDSLNSLIGSPRGYIGSEEGELTLKISASRMGVLLIDEFEKANSSVWSFFLDLLETGSFTDSQGNKHDLNGYVIVFTTNAPRDHVNKIFPPELLSRFNLKVEFKQLTSEGKHEFVGRYIANAIAKYNDLGQNQLPSLETVIAAAQTEIDIEGVDNIRVLKNETRKWFANYVSLQRHSPKNTSS